jgi:hypothetical protein
MEKIERGKRNLEKFRKISDPKVARGSVTFWNPTQDQKTTATIHLQDASLITQFYDLLDDTNKQKFLLGIATVHGFDKLLDYAWSRSQFKATVISNYKPGI